MTPAEVAATRRLIGLTVDQLADRLGVNPRTVRGWESGKYSPGDSVCDAIQDICLEHDRVTGPYVYAAEQGGLVIIPRGPEPSGWYLAVAARVLDRVPDARIEWKDEHAR